MVAISAFRVMQHSQIFSLFFRNRIQCIALYQLHSSQALLNLRRGYFRPGFHYTTNATTTTQKQSDYEVEQSSFTLIALL